MKAEAGAAFAHYLRTDKNGARPIPPDWLDTWTQRGWLVEPDEPAAEKERVPIPATVLDPFGGAGTVALVAQQHGRNAILCELNPDYVEMSKQRLAAPIPPTKKVRTKSEPITN